MELSKMNPKENKRNLWKEFVDADNYQVKQLILSFNNITLLNF